MDGTIFYILNIGTTFIGICGKTLKKMELTIFQKKNLNFFRFEILLCFGVPDDQILLHFGVPDNCSMNNSS